MELEQLKARFFELVSPDLPNDWDVEEAMEGLENMATRPLAAVLEQVPIIWPISNSLCYSYLVEAGKALDCIETDLLPQWVNETLDQYEQHGLRAAQRFMTEIHSRFVCRLQGQSGIRFSRIEGRLLPYARGLVKTGIDLKAAEQCSTDTTTIFLPNELSLMAEEADNFLLYKLMVSFQWGFIALNSFLVSREPGQANPDGEGKLWLAAHFAGFSQPDLIRDIYYGLETLRVRIFLDQELPGLMRDAEPLLAEFFPTESEQNCGNDFFTCLGQMITRPAAAPETNWQQRLQPFLNNDVTALDSLALAEEIFNSLSQNSLSIPPVSPLPFQGAIRLKQVAAARLRQRQEQKQLFIDSLAFLLLNLPAMEKKDGDKSEKTDKPGQPARPPEDASALIMPDRQLDNPEPTVQKNDQPRFITINNQEIELSEELQELATLIRNDLGQIPDQYISSAAGKAGQGDAGAARLAAGQGEALSAPITYDEWDFRRSGFRRNWCIVTEKEIPVSRSNFIRTTLETYHGLIIRLRHQFEMMRTTERFLRRQRDGDDIDLDALVESLADSKAGQPPSDRLFIRLQRDERDIAALFLVDMSNSTRGWVGRAIKESLVLICEAMEALGDRYAIYGFSGMRRLRCEIFPIKDMEQPYDDGVRQRIGSIAPREYTRMAPAIRHTTAILQEVDAKVRLLITLSDGKPEDYDDYKGEYAIEDTRHALIEAKMAGIHPFCITIDQHAHEYMGHMYGEVNYIFINDVRKLPARMPEIYRVLTS